MSIIYHAIICWIVLYVVKYASIWLRTIISNYFQIKKEESSSSSYVSIRDYLFNALDNIWNSISINPFVINIEIKRSLMNNIYRYLTFKDKKYVSIFLNIGVCLMLMGVLITPFYLLSSLMNNIFTTPQTIYSHEHDMSSVSSAIITPIIPGVNFPLRLAFIFWVCYTIVSVIHELGHSIAALNEGLEMENFGVFFAFLFPGAYVTIEDTVKYLPIMPQLRIYSGGIYANFLFAIVCYLVMSLSSVGLHLGGYIRPDGIVVAHLPSRSVLSSHLHLGNTIREVGYTPIHNSVDWLVAIDHVKTSTTTFSYTWISTGSIDRQYVGNGGSHANILSLNDKSYQHAKPTIINITSRSINTIELKLSNEYNNTISDVINNDVIVINNDVIDENKEIAASVDDVMSNKKTNVNTNTNGTIPMTINNRDNKNITTNNYVNKVNGSFVNDSINNNDRRLATTSSRARIYTRTAGKGFCYDNAAIFDIVSNDISCCDDVFVLSAAVPDSNYCFMHALQTFNSSTVYGPDDKEISWVCAPALHMYDKSFPSCVSDNDCDEDTKCLRPVTKHLSDHLVRIRYTDQSNQEKFLLFEGSLLLLSSTNTVGVANYDSMWIRSLLSIKGLGIITSFFERLYSYYIFLPDMIYLSLWLCSQLSLSLSILNTLPIVSLDGGHVFPQIVRYFYPSKQWYDLSMAFIYPCTGILIINIILSMYKHNWF